MAEFALCAPLVFAILFGVINGGLFMYAKNAVTRASNVGAVTMAAEGVADSVDVDTLAAMRQAGVSANSLVGVQWVEFAEVTYSASCQCYQVVNTCTTASGSGNQPCANRYDINGNYQWNPPVTCTDAVYHCPPWGPAVRSVTASSASIVRSTVHYTFSFLATGQSFSLDEVNIFRLEPRQVG